MTIYDKNNKKLAQKISGEDLKPGLSFFTEDADYLQVGSWRYPAGKNLAAHIHNVVPRQIQRTQEFIFIVQGSLKASVFDEEENPIEEVILRQHEGLILFAGAHGYEMLEEDTIVIEVKNGPYPGAEIDRRRIEGE